MSFGPDPKLLPDIVADYIARILAGARPADLPVQQPSEFEMVLNRSTARALGLAFPSAMLARANRVVD